MIALLTLAAAAYLHAHPDAFYLAGTMSTVMYLAVVVGAILWAYALYVSTFR